MVSTLKLKSGKTELHYRQGFLCVYITTKDVDITNSTIGLNKVTKLETRYDEPDNKLKFHFDSVWGFTLIVEDHKEANELASYLLTALIDANNPTTTL